MAPDLLVMEVVRYLIYLYSPVHPVILESQRFACLKLLENVQSEPKLNSSYNF